MSTSEHERIEELLAVRALGGLEPREVAQLDRMRADHGVDCEICARAELEFDEIAGRLAFALSPVAVREGMADEILERALLAPERPSEPRRRATGRRPRMTRWVAAVAAAIVLVAGAFGGGILVGSSGGPSQAQQLASYLAHSDAHVVPFEGSGTGNLLVAYRPGTDRAYVFGSQLNPTPSGKAYELWLVPPGGKPVPMPTFTTPGGDSLVVVQVPADVSSSAAMAVTLEQAGGSPTGQPTTDIIFTAPIQA
ncbi:MAG TPA: anti-sigma factor [Actinomycetota bacterium]